MRGVALASILAACSFQRGDGKQQPISDGAPPIDEAPLCMPEPYCSDETTLTSCPDGTTPMSRPCPWGCLETGGAHCGELLPTGGGVRREDLANDPELEDVLALTGTVDTTSGAISGIRGPGPGVINGIGFAVNNGVAVFRFRDVHITGPLALAGQNAVALVALRSIQVDGLVDVRGSCTGNESGPGGFPGGNGAVAALGPGAGVSGQGTNTDNSGGGGAGHGVAGSNGGRSNNGGQPGGPYGEMFTTLVGGSGGGAGGGANGGVGGGGGGAIQLVANGAIRFGGGGGINAGGCGGRRKASNHDDGGGGGGSGGTILLEAPEIFLGASAVLAVNGGAGGGGDGNGGNGGAGVPARTPAPGGANGGGSGGAPVDFDGQPGGDNNGNGGGGGGAIGRIRIETRTGVASIDPGAVMSPSLGDTATTAVSVEASVQ